MRHTRARDLLPLETLERHGTAATDVPLASSKSIANPLWRGLGSAITPTGGGSAHLPGYLTFTESHDPSFQPTPTSTEAIDNRAPQLRRQAKMAKAGNHLFDDVASMTYTFL
jgi:hypothetical protein